MLMARNAVICSRCLVTEPWVRSFIFAAPFRLCWIHERASLWLQSHRNPGLRPNFQATTHEIIRFGKFQRIGDRRCQDRRVVFLRRRKHAFDLSRSNQRAGRVVHGDELDLFLEGLQSNPDRILSEHTATNYPADLSEIRFYDQMPHRYGIARYHENVVYTDRLFECGQGMLNDRTAGDFDHELVKTSSLATPGSDDDGA